MSTDSLLGLIGELSSDFHRYNKPYFISARVLSLATYDIKSDKTYSLVLEPVPSV